MCYLTWFEKLFTRKLAYALPYAVHVAATIDGMAFDASSASHAFETAHAQAVAGIKPYSVSARGNSILGISETQEEQRIIDINTPWEEDDNQHGPSAQGRGPTVRVATCAFVSHIK